jgi:hypothetical protein
VTIEKLELNTNTARPEFIQFRYEHSGAQDTNQRDYKKNSADDFQKDMHYFHVTDAIQNTETLW